MLYPCGGNGFFHYVGQRRLCVGACVLFTAGILLGGEAEYLAVRESVKQELALQTRPTNEHAELEAPSSVVANLHRETLCGAHDLAGFTCALRYTAIHLVVSLRCAGQCAANSKGLAGAFIGDSVRYIGHSPSMVCCLPSYCAC